MDVAGVDHLQEYCRTARSSLKLITPPYWTSEVYGFGKGIRHYGFYPSFLPLFIFTDHSPAGFVAVNKLELESDSIVQFYHSPDKVAEWRKVSSKPCFCLFSPFVFQRRSAGIDRSSDACGTLAFPAHTTESIDDQSSVEQYIRTLEGLPDEYQPVSICMHQTDILKGRHLTFLGHGFAVHTAGSSLDDRYAERFYAILRKFKFATSNVVGAYSYYSVEMGIPFFLAGSPPEYLNRADPNIPIGRYDPYALFSGYRRAHDLFTRIQSEVTEEQRRFVLHELGVEHGLTRTRMALVLYGALVVWLLRPKSWSYILLDIRARFLRLVTRLVHEKRFRD